MDKGTIALYAEGLSDLPVAALALAAREHIQESEFFPTVAELRRRAMALLVNAVPTAPQAWAAAREWVRRHGDREDLNADVNAAVTQAIRQVFGSWRGFRQSDDTSFNEARFRKAYEGLVGAEYRRLTEHPALGAAKAQFRLESGADSEGGEDETLRLEGGEDAEA